MKLVSTQQVPLPMARERRQSVLYAAVWMVFEILAVAGLLEPPAVPTWQLALGLSCVAAFSVTYLWMFHVNPDGAELWASRRFVRRGAIGGFGLLWVLVVALGLVRVGAAVALFPFIIAYAAYTLPYVVTALNWATGVVAGLGIWWTGTLPSGWLFSVAVSAAIVTVTGLLSRYRRHVQDQLRADKEMVVRLTERERIASDMHDLLGQTLTVTAMKAELVQRLIPTSPDKAVTEAQEVQHLARTALHQVRELVSQLHEVSLDTQLVVARSALQAAGIEPKVEDHRSAAAQDTSQDDTFDSVRGWVLREAVTNVVRHSGAAQCRMWIGDEKLCICDDGSGLGDAVWGNGLTGMRRRVDAAGGELTVGPGPDGHGTCVGVIG